MCGNYNRQYVLRTRQICYTYGMVDVQFTDVYTKTQPRGEIRSGKIQGALTRMIFATHVVRTEKMAHRVIVIVASITILVSFFLLVPRIPLPANIPEVPEDAGVQVQDAYDLSPNFSF